MDVQPHYFGGLLDRVDLVIDHHPEQPGYSAVFKDIRADYGSTSTILTEHLRAVDVNISERTATAMLYAIKSDTLFFARHTNRVDLEAFTFLYPLADAALIRKMEGAEITLERLEYVTRASQDGILRDQVFTAFLGEAPREDFIPYTADFFLQLEDVKWTIVAGIVGELADRQRAEPGLLAQRRRIREAVVRRHRQRRRPSRDGQGGRADRSVPREVRRPRRRRRSTARIADMAEQFLHEPAEREEEGTGAQVAARLRAAERLIEIRDQIARGLPARPTAAPCLCVTPARSSSSAVWPHCEVSTGRLQRLSMPPRLAARLNDLQPIEEARRALVAARRGRRTPSRRSRTSAAPRARDPDATRARGSRRGRRAGPCASQRRPPSRSRSGAATRTASVFSPRPSA